MNRLLLILLPLFLLGCLHGQVAPPGERADPDLDWSPEQIGLHLQTLDSVEQEGRRVATPGFTRSTTYVADRLRKSGLHPMLSGEYRFQYAAALDVVLGAGVTRMGPDTLSLVHGSDFLLDASSGSGTIQFNTRELQENKGVLSISGRPTVLISNLGSAGLFETQSTPLIRISADHWKRAKRRDDRWVVTVVADSDISTAGIHVAGLIPGAHPVRRDSLILIIAPLDGDGLQGERSWSDGSDSALPAAALLELARRTSLMQQRWSLFEHSILIAFVSGTRRTCRGPKALMRNFPWKRSNVISVVVLNARQDSTCDLVGVMSEGLPAAQISFVEIFPPAVALGKSEFAPFFERERLSEEDFTRPAVREAMEVVKKTMDVLLNL